MKLNSITARGYIKNMRFPVSKIQACCAYPELFTLGNHFAHGLKTKMADVPDNAPKREYLLKCPRFV